MRRAGSAVVALIGVWVLALSPTSLAWAALLLANALNPDAIGSKSAAIIGVGVASVPFLLAVAVGWTLVSRRAWISARLFDDVPLPPAADGPHLLGAAVVLLGLFLCVTALGESVRVLTTSVAQIIQLGASGTGRFFATSQTYILVPQMIAFLAQFAAGLYFVLRSARVSSWASSLQPDDA
jgi:hypothetical protein